jgi:hypothetical protein
MAHKHICKSKFYEGTRVQTHYDDRCTESYEAFCLECDDEELAAQGATWEYHDHVSVSDADTGL